jgi:hypothetical protein
MCLSSRPVPVSRSDWHGKGWRCTAKGSIKRLLLVASIVNLLFSSSLGNSHAADPYDGEWTGSATAARDGRCTRGSVKLTVNGSQVTGQAKFDVEARNIYGTVHPDGTFGGTVGFQHLVGKFTDDTFEGAFRTPDCAWILNLKRSRPTSLTPSSRELPRAPTFQSRIVMPT